MTWKEFQKATVGWDRCERCGQVKPLVLAHDMNTGKALDIMPDGNPVYVCFDCLHELRT